MAKDKLVTLSVDEKPTPTKETASDKGKGKKRFGESVGEPAVDVPPAPWHLFLQTATVSDIRQRFSREAEAIVAKHSEDLGNYYCLGVLDPEGNITQWELDQIFTALLSRNASQDKDILLIVLSRGGSIEPAYQISKLCKTFAKERFSVAVPRQAKSAATLLAIGADQIHMGPLGQLGPIDPQLGGLPALGVSQALESIASLAQRFPGSSEMFARYLRMALTVEQIGYCERISESAVQYAQRLLLTKPELQEDAAEIARELVHEYKDHGFVIDIDEARKHLGNGWILTETEELALAEEIYNLFDNVNLFLGMYQSKRLLVSGDFTSGIMVLDNPKNA